MLNSFAILGLVQALFNLAASLVMTLWFLPYRLLSRLTEKLIEQHRAGGWQTSMADQMKLNLATRMALGQAVQFELYPRQANWAIRFTRALGVR